MKVLRFAAVLPFLLFALGAPVASVASPNFILINTDDMAEGDFRYMPRTLEHFASSGVQFTNAFVTHSICGPSRVSLLTGQYARNSGVTVNPGPAGGFDAFLTLGLESETVAAKLQAVGYRTAYFGKFINGYGSSKLVPKTYVPFGWDDWYVLAQTLRYYDYTLNENGRLVSYGSAPADYAGDVIANHAVRHLEEVLDDDGAPFFMMVAPFAPHSSGGEDSDGDGFPNLPVVAPRHQGLFTGLSAPRSGSFNLLDVSKKPSAIRNKPLLTQEEIAWIDANFQARMQSLQTVDEMVERLVNVLRSHPRGSETYIIFSSDNGYFYGDHRFLYGKGNTYDQATRIPLAVSGPSVVPGRVRDNLVTNIDIFPTVLELAGSPVSAGSFDGQSIRNLMEAANRETGFDRKAFMLESGSVNRNGIRFGNYAYLETPAGKTPFKEVYDTRLDPGLAHNLADQLTPASLTALQGALADFKACRGDTCRLLGRETTEDLILFRTF